MVIFKQSTHSILDKMDFSELMDGKGNFLLGTAGLFGANKLLKESIDKDKINDLYNRLPDRIKDKIEKGLPLNSNEKRQEIDIIQRESNIKFRNNFEGINSLDELNNLYRTKNPVGMSSSSYNNRFNNINEDDDTEYDDYD